MTITWAWGRSRCHGFLLGCKDLEVALVLMSSCSSIITQGAQVSQLPRCFRDFFNNLDGQSPWFHKHIVEAANSSSWDLSSRRLAFLMRRHTSHSLANSPGSMWLNQIQSSKHPWSQEILRKLYSSKSIITKSIQISLLLPAMSKIPPLPHKSLGSISPSKIAEDLATCNVMYLKAGEWKGSGFVWVM